MPILKDVRKTETIALPSFEGSEIVVYSTLLVKDLSGLDMGKIDLFGLKALAKLIKSWNLTDENNAVLPVTEANIGLLPATDIQIIVDTIAKLNTSEKKE